MPTPSTEVSDGDLVRLARADDLVAFRLLVERHQPMVRARARQLGPDPGDVDDIMQESFLQAFLALDRLRDPDRFAGWLAGIVVNVGRSRYHRRAPVTLLADWPEPLHPASAAGLPSAAELDLQSHRQDFTATGRDGTAVLAAAVPQPAGFAWLAQEILADDYRSTAVTFRGQFGVADVTGRARLFVRTMEARDVRGPFTAAEALADPKNRVVTVASEAGWARHEVTAPIPAGTSSLVSGCSWPVPAGSSCVAPS